MGISGTMYHTKLVVDQMVAKPGTNGSGSLKEEIEKKTVV